MHLPSPDWDLLAALDEHGYAIARDAIDPALRERLRAAAERLLDSDETRGRDRGADGKDGFRGCVDLDPAFTAVIANPRILPTVVAALSPNLHLMSSHLIALPSPPPHQRTIRTPERPGWHRDMYGVSADLGHDATPRLAVKAAYYLTDPAPECGPTMFLPGSHRLSAPPNVPEDAIDPPGALTPDLGPNDVVLFDNRTWHAGGLNTSGRPRLALMMQYGYRWLAPVDDPHHPDVIAQPGLDPIERQLLGAHDRDEHGAVAKGRGAAPLTAWWNHLTTAEH